MTYHRGFGASVATTTPDMTFTLEETEAGSSMTSVPAREAQTALYARGFDIGSAGADGNFGTASRAALVRALERVYRGPVPSSAWSATTSSIRVRSDLWPQVLALPMTRSSAPPSGGGTSTRTTSTPEAPLTPPEVEEPGIMSRLTSGYTPWVIGGVVLAGIGAVIVLSPKKVSANRRRRHRRHR